MFDQLSNLFNGNRFSFLVSGPSLSANDEKKQCSDEVGRLNESIATVNTEIEMEQSGAAEQAPAIKLMKDDAEAVTESIEEAAPAEDHQAAYPLTQE